MEIVGTNRPSSIASGNAMKRYLAEKVLPFIGLTIQSKIRSKLNTYNFKKGVGSPKMRDAVRMRVDQQKLEVVVFNERSLAPYAIWQEKGVHRQKMTWLIGKTIPYKIINGHFVFAGKGSPFFLKDSNVKFAKITAESFNRTNPVTGKPAWEHPGYPGKYFYRDGLRESLPAIRAQLRDFTLRVAGDAELTGGPNG
jgi:hypothetical protein